MLSLIVTFLPHHGDCCVRDAQSVVPASQSRAIETKPTLPENLHARVRTYSLQRAHHNTVLHHFYNFCDVKGLRRAGGRILGFSIDFRTVVLTTAYTTTNAGIYQIF